MQNLTKIIGAAKRNAHVADQHILNIIREYLQVLILKAIYLSKYGKALSFMGGTCLRMCYGLKRYSEDLDFTLDRKIPGYSFGELNEIVANFLKNTDFEVDFKFNEEKTVQTSFIRVSKVLHLFGVSTLKTQKLHVKLEVDTKPVKISNKKRESFFLTKFDEIFPIIKQTDETLFAGKIAAILIRSFTKGRDFYDLIWFLTRRTNIDLKYLNSRLKQANLNLKFKDTKAVIHELEKRISQVNTNAILKDMGRFLEDPQEEKWLKQYKDVCQCQIEMSYVLPNRNVLFAA